MDECVYVIPKKRKKNMRQHSPTTYNSPRPCYCNTKTIKLSLTISGLDHDWRRYQPSTLHRLPTSGRFSRRAQGCDQAKSHRILLQWNWRDLCQEWKSGDSCHWRGLVSDYHFPQIRLAGMTPFPYQNTHWDPCSRLEKENVKRFLSKRNLFGIAYLFRYFQDYHQYHTDNYKTGIVLHTCSHVLPSIGNISDQRSVEQINLQLNAHEVIYFSWIYTFKGGYASMPAQLS